MSLDRARVVIAVFMIFITSLSFSSIANSANLNKQKRCIEEALYFEARGLSVNEMILIFEVISNRVKSYRYPDTFCKVISQRYQFSYRNGVHDESEIILPKIQNIVGIYDRIAWYRIKGLVHNLFTMNGAPVHNKYLSMNTLHYHRKDISVYWSSSGKKVELPFNTKHYFITGVK